MIKKIMKGEITVVVLTEENFQQEVIKSKLPVLVDFFATWCGPCQIAEPVIEELAKDYEGKIKIGKLDIDQNQKIASQYQIMSIPTIVLFKEGKVVKKLVGFFGREAYEKLIKEVIGG